MYSKLCIKDFIITLPDLNDISKDNYTQYELGKSLAKEYKEINIACNDTFTMSCGMKNYRSSEKLLSTIPLKFMFIGLLDGTADIYVHRMLNNSMKTYKIYKIYNEIEYCIIDPYNKLSHKF